MATIIELARTLGVSKSQLIEELANKGLTGVEENQEISKNLEKELLATVKPSPKTQEEIAREFEEWRVASIKALDLYFGDEKFETSLEKSKITSQTEVLARLLNRESVFISGPAGSGKSSVVKTFIELLELESEGNVRIAITASTGMAASLIEGQTIHSWAGLGISTEPFNPKDIPRGMWLAKKRMAETDVLIIDEVSMIPLYLFEKLDKAMRWARKSSRPFGGVQLVLMGDFLQLPPVSKADDEVDARFIVFSDSWKELDIKYCYLDRIHRAKDKKLLYVLNSIAAGKVNEKTRQLLESRIISPEEGRDYTKLYTTNRNVDAENEKMLALNKNKIKTYYAGSTGAKKEVEKAFKKYNIPRAIDLKKDAVVMLTKNTSQDGEFYPNGTIGRVVKMEDNCVHVRCSNRQVVRVYYTLVQSTKKKFVEVKDENGKIVKKTEEEVLAAISYLPLKLGYAITVHKAQGTTIDSVQADLTKCFTPGLGYVALSRARELDDLILLGYDDRALTVDPISAKVSNIVRTKAKKDRESLKKDIGLYDGLISQPTLRALKWRW